MDYVGYLSSFSFTKYLFDLPLCNSLNRGFGGGLTGAWFIPIIHPFLLEKFLIVAFLVCSSFLGFLFEKCHTPYVLVVTTGLIIF